METNSNHFVMIPNEELNELKKIQLRILDLIERKTKAETSKQIQKGTEYITAQEFMDALSISRSTFDSLRDENKIKVIQKRRKLYLEKNAIEKYMNS
jgi:hypothetical protein